MNFEMLNHALNVHKIFEYDTDIYKLISYIQIPRNKRFMSCYNVKSFRLKYYVINIFQITWFELFLKFHRTENFEVRITFD